jgi:hypothetical protein
VEEAFSLDISLGEKAEANSSRWQRESRRARSARLAAALPKPPRNVSRQLRGVRVAWRGAAHENERCHPTDKPNGSLGGRGHR